MENVKVCSKCGEEKPLSEFWKNRSTFDGLQYQCKTCLINRKEERIRSKKWYQNNKDKSQESHKEYYQVNQDRIRSMSWHWYQLNKEKKKKQRKEHYQDTKGNMSGQHRANRAMSRSIWKALKGNKNGRRWEKLVGYTLHDLITHLELLFDTKMNWGNYGSYWHIDHIKPKSLFKYDSQESSGFKECWALENLQPLEAIENIKKGNRYVKN